MASDRAGETIDVEVLSLPDLLVRRLDPCAGGPPRRQVAARCAGAEMLASGAQGPVAKIPQIEPDDCIAEAHRIQPI